MTYRILFYNENTEKKGVNMKRLLQNDFYCRTYEGNKIISAEGMIIIILLNISLTYIVYLDIKTKIFSFDEAIMFGVISLLLVFIQVIFSSIQWETKTYKIVAELAFWTFIFELMFMIQAMMFLL